jgi:hypothetical protein
VCQPIKSRQRVLRDASEFLPEASHAFTQTKQLLSRYRRQKRYLMLLAALLLVALGVFVAWWLLPGLLLLGWVVHEAWLADHLFYSPHDDYQYRFPPDTPRQQVSLRDGRVQLSEPLAAGETLILEVELRSSGLGTLV